MRSFLAFLSFTCVLIAGSPTVLYAQSLSALQVDSLDMKDSWAPSYYPLFRSATTPLAAESANKALQLSDLNHLLTPDYTKSWMAFCAQHDQKSCWLFQSKTVTPNFMVVKIIRYGWGTASTRGSPEIDSRHYYFHATTGDPILHQDFIKPQKLSELGRVATQLLLQVSPKQDCHDNINGAWDKDEVMMYMDVERKEIVFELMDCYAEALESTAPIRASVPWVSMSDFLQPYFFEMMKAEQVLTPDGISHLWNGTIGSGIRITLLLRGGANDVSGVEAYNKYGIPIAIKGKQNGNRYTLSEVDDNQKVVGTFELTLENRKLTGTWSNGTKTLPFSASIAGEK